MNQCLKRYKLPLCDLITVYCGYIRPILDYGVPVFNGSLTVMNCCSLETIQKRACRIMLGDAYITYKIALEKCTLVTLKDRRKKIYLLILLVAWKVTHSAKSGYLSPKVPTTH